MKPGKKMDPLTRIELDAEQRAQEYKRKLIKEGIERLAAEQSEAISPPKANPVSPREESPDHSYDDSR